jgi:hypothetical protein
METRLIFNNTEPKVASGIQDVFKVKVYLKIRQWPGAKSEVILRTNPWKMFLKPSVPYTV